MTNIIEWQEWETRPRTGEQFLCWNGEEMGLFNEPEGCALGRWEKRGGKWYGAIERFDSPILWSPRPKIPPLPK